MAKMLGPVRSSSQAVGPVGGGAPMVPGGGGGGGPKESELTLFLRAHPIIGILIALGCFVGAFWTFISALLPALSTAAYWIVGSIVGVMVLYSVYWLWYWTRPPKDFPSQQDEPRA